MGKSEGQCHRGYKAFVKRYEIWHSMSTRKKKGGTSNSKSSQPMYGSRRISQLGHIFQMATWLRRGVIGVGAPWHVVKASVCLETSIGPDEHRDDNEHRSVQGSLTHRPSPRPAANATKTSAMRQTSIAPYPRIIVEYAAYEWYAGFRAKPLERWKTVTELSPIRIP